MYAFILQVYRELYLPCKEVPGSSVLLVVCIQDIGEKYCGVVLDMCFFPYSENQKIKIGRVVCANIQFAD